MELLNALENRHAVRSYLDKPLEKEIKDKLQGEASLLNQKHKMHIQMVYDEPKAFDGFMAHYGHFENVKNYVALIGPKEDKTPEILGYCGEDLVLLAQSLGVNSCFVGLTYKKVGSAFKIEKGEKLYCVISLGYGSNQGVFHKQKEPSAISNLASDSPDWFKEGVHGALLAPTAVNQEKFFLEYKDGKVAATAGSGFFVEMDLGIMKKNFEIASGKDSSIWIN